MEKVLWFIMVGVAVGAGFLSLDRIPFAIVIFLLFVFVSTALFLRFQKDHWLDRVSPLVGVGIGVLSLVLYALLFVTVASVFSTNDVWSVLARLVFMYVGLYVFVLTTSSFLAAVVRGEPSRFFRPLLIFSVFFYGTMLLIPLQPGL